MRVPPPRKRRPCTPACRVPQRFLTELGDRRRLPEPLLVLLAGLERPLMLMGHQRREASPRNDAKRSGQRRRDQSPRPPNSCKNPPSGAGFCMPDPAQ